VRIGPAELARLRPLNELTYGGAAARIGRGRPVVDPRLLAFLAHAAAVGLLTMKGMVENADDPLRWSDAELVDGLASVLAAAAGGPAAPRARRATKRA
jgi:hypothetical protein